MSEDKPQKPIVVLLSFTAGLDAISCGEISSHDLETAIFCLGCTKEFLQIQSVPILKAQEPHQKHPISVELIDAFKFALAEAERDNRVIWRRGFNYGDALRKISSVLESQGLEPLNPNLPESIGLNSDALKTAIERVNNKIGVQRVMVIIPPLSP